MTSGNSKEPSPTPGSGRWRNLLLLLVVSAVSLWAADRLFIAYERSQLLPRLPNVHATGPVNLSALQYNDTRVERQSGPGEFRVLSFGDSFTHSVMEPQLSYSGVVQDRLQAALPDRQIRVINLGEPATGTRSYRKAYDFWSQVLEHDAVLFHIFLGNDILDDAYLYPTLEWGPNSAIFTSDSPILLAANPRVPQKFPLRMLDYAYAWWMSSRTRSDNPLPEGYNWAGSTSFDIETFNAVNLRYLENFDPGELDILLAGYEQVYRLLLRAEEIAKTGKPVAVALGPAQAQVDSSIRAQAIASIDGEVPAYELELPQKIIFRIRDRVAPNVQLLDLSPMMTAYHESTGEGLYFRRNTHWDRDGNRVAGELIADFLLTHWFEKNSTMSLPEYEGLSTSGVDIDAYLSPLLDRIESGILDVTGAVRAIQLMDGIAGQSENWAIAPLNKPITIKFSADREFSAMRVHLYHSDGRKYRFVVDAFQDNEWQMLADHSIVAVGGIQDIPLSGPVSAIRITGLYNSVQQRDPSNAFLHIEEIEFFE